MAQTHRSDAALIAGRHHSGNRGLGVLGGAVPATGENGAGYLYASLSLPADANTEVRGVIVQQPVGATFGVCNEDSSFALLGADGAYSFTVQLVSGGVSVGSPYLVSASIGSVATLTVVLDDATAAMSAAGAAPGFATLAVVLDDATAAMTAAGAAPGLATLAVVLDDAVAAMSATVVSTGSVPTTLTQDLQALLLPLASGGAWYGANTQEPPSYPYITWLRISSSPNVSLQGPSLLQNTHIQIDIFSLYAAESQTIEVAIEAAFIASSITNVPLSSADRYEDMVRAYRITKEYSVWAVN